VDGMVEVEVDTESLMIWPVVEVDQDILEELE